jgi:hypothetical protein
MIGNKFTGICMCVVLLCVFIMLIGAIPSVLHLLGLIPYYDLHKPFLILFLVLVVSVLAAFVSSMISLFKD